jgi:hypothetical protein
VEELAEEKFKELEILGHQVQTAHQQAPFGVVTSGEIVVHGRLRAMLFIQSFKTEQLWSRDKKSRGAKICDCVAGHLVHRPRSEDSTRILLTSMQIQ